MENKYQFRSCYRKISIRAYVIVVLIFSMILVLGCGKEEDSSNKKVHNWSKLYGFDDEIEELKEKVTNSTQEGSAGGANKEETSIMNPKFSKEDIYEQAKKDFIEIYEDSYSMVDRMYMSVKYESVVDSKFNYDAEMDEYNIRFKITISEFGELFDKNYVLRATYTTDAYGSLEAVSFNLE